MRTAKSVLWIGIALSLSCLAGCSKDWFHPTGLSSSEADELNAQHSHFDGKPDAAFTADTHFAAGQLAESQGAYRRATEQYAEAIKVDKHHLPSLYRLGVVHALLKDWPSAIEAWKTYAKQCDNDPAALANLAFCYELAGQPDRAEATYREGISHDPKSEACRINYGLMLARNGRSTEALLQFQAVLSEAQAHYNVASSLEQQGKRDAARVEYRKALEIDPSLEDARARLAGIE